MFLFCMIGNDVDLIIPFFFFFLTPCMAHESTNPRGPTPPSACGAHLDLDVDMT